MAADKNKKVEKMLKLQIPAGQASPAPPVGPALGQAGINIGQFTTEFNAATQEMRGDIVPVVIYVYDDRSYSFDLKTPPASALIMKAAGIKAGSGKNVLKKAGKITMDQAREIAERKLVDLSANDVEAGAKIIAGTARSMGVEVVD